MADRLLGGLVALLGVTILLLTSRLPSPFQDMGDPGPRLLPFIVGGGLVLFGLMIVIEKTAAPSEPPSAEPGAEPAPDPRAADRLPPLVMAALGLALVGYAAAFAWIGFGTSTAVFVAIGCFLLSARRPRDLAVAAGFGVAVSAVTGWLLSGLVRIPLPGVWFL